MRKKIENIDKNTETNKLQVSFSALYPTVVNNIVLPIEKEQRTVPFVLWGDKNDYPQYIQSLYNDCTLFRTVVEGIASYVVGDGVTTSNNMIFREPIEELVRLIAIDYLIYGGFTLEIKKSLNHNIVQIGYININRLRTDKLNTEFYYSEDWKKSSGRVDYIKYPSFSFQPKDGEPKGNFFTSIYYFKNNINKIYPQAITEGSAAYAIEVLKSIAKYHLNAIKNNFSGGYIVNFNSGNPTDEMKAEIEKNFQEKFTSEDNAGRVLLAFNPNKDNEATITAVPVDNFKDKYDSLSKEVKQEIYSAYRVHPVLFGLPTENSGFNDQDFQEAFKLTNRTVVQPIQKIIKNTLKYLSSADINIIPFTIDWSEDENNKIIK